MEGMDQYNNLFDYGNLLMVFSNGDRMYANPIYFRFKTNFEKLFEEIVKKVSRKKRIKINKTKKVAVITRPKHKPQGPKELTARQLMEKKLGRKLKRREHVHHKDGNRTNNDLNNLEIVPPSLHFRRHNKRITRPDGRVSYIPRIPLRRKPIK